MGFYIDEMKRIYVIPIIASLFAVAAGVALAAGINLNNGGLGQIASDPSRFGVAVCNGGKSVVTQSVPVSVSVGGQTTSLSSPTPIQVGSCSYAYATYGQLGMQSGKSYSISVTIDPQHTTISNTNNQATYTVQVPGAIRTTAQTETGTSGGTANVNAQSGNIFTTIFNWFAGLFGGK